MLRNVPLAANPKRAMLITIKERWFHWLMENTLVRSTSKVRDEKDNKNTALRIMYNHQLRVAGYELRVTSDEMNII